MGDLEDSITTLIHGRPRPLDKAVYPSWNQQNL